MIARTAGALTAFALAANAFILPPTADAKDFSGSDFTGLTIDTESQLFKLPCSACVFKNEHEQATENQDGDGLLWAQGGANDVLFNFTISEDRHSFKLNDFTLYPMPMTWDSSMRRTVYQVPSSASLADIKSGKVNTVPLAVTGEGIGITSEEPLSKLGDQLVTMSYDVIALENQPANLDRISIQLLQSAEGELMILAVDAVPSTVPEFISDIIELPDQSRPTPSKEHEHAKEKECKNLPAMLCKWKNDVEDKIVGFKQGMPAIPNMRGKFGGCSGRKGPGPTKLPGHIRPHLDIPGDMQDRPNNHHGRPPKGMRPPHRGPHAHGHHGYHHHRPHHHVMHSFMIGALTILVPLACGMVLGAVVSLIGFMVGRLIAFLWIKYRRGGERGYASVAQSEDGDEQALEKGVVATEEDTEALPMYEEAPAYEEKE